MIRTVRKKKGFSLTELSIVLVILAILVSSIATGRKIVDNANVQSILTEVEKYKSVINQFIGTYDSLPGDVPPSGIKGSLGSVSNYYAENGAGTGTIRKDAMLDAFQQLLRAKLLDNYNNYTSSFNGGISIWLNADYIPYASFSRKATWLIASAGETAPFEAMGADGWNGKSLRLILVGSAESINEPASFYSNSVTSSMAYKIDAKLDDAEPLNGFVIGGKYAYAARSDCTSGARCDPTTLVLDGLNDASVCHTGTSSSVLGQNIAADFRSQSSTAKYSSNTEIKKGCIMSFKVTYAY